MAYSDASYNCGPCAKSRAGGYVFLGDRDHPERINGAILASSTLLSLVASSAAEAEYGAAFVAKEIQPLRMTMQTLGYTDLTCELFVDNECAIGLATNTVKQMRSRAIDMRYHWLRERTELKHFRIQWVPTKSNIADFFTKCLPVATHSQYRNLFLASATCRRRLHRQPSA